MTDDARFSRRDLLRSLAVAGAGAGLVRPAHGSGLDGEAQPPVRQSMMGVPFEPRDVVRIGIVGTGLRGRSLLGELLGVGDVRIAALCDIVPDKVAMARDMMMKAGHDYEVETYTSGERAFEKLCEQGDLDLVITATPWEWHVPVCLAALAHGIHAATEVPAARTIDECWDLVDASERARRHCIMLENCCYGYTELLVLQMVRAGLFGELKHGGAAYNHDLREILFETKDEGLWRRAEHTRRDGNLYPTHGLGPVAWYLDIHRGDRFEYLVSMSTPEMGLTKWREARVPKGDPRWRERYVTGDLNVSLIRTVRGRTIRLEHDVASPRPYSRINSIQGTNGIFEDYPPRLYIEGRGAAHRWGTIDEYRAEHEHPWWREQGRRAESGGHGGMDFIMAWRLVTCMRQGLPPDMDVYDAAAWSAPGPLSVRSVAKGSAPQRFPDFTRGRWKHPSPND